MMHDTTRSMTATPEPADWHVRLDSVDPARDDWAGTVFALANGAIGIRGVLDEQQGHGAATFLATAYEVSPIHYHERLKGFAESTDTRVPVADAATLAIAVNGELIASPGVVPIACERILDLRTGDLVRRTIWPSAAGPISVTARRSLPMDGEAVALLSYEIAPIDSAAEITVTSGLRTPPAPADQGKDPRIGTANLGGLLTTRIDAADGMLVESTRRSGITIAAACLHGSAAADVAVLQNGFAQHFSGRASTDAPFALVKAVSYATEPSDKQAETTARTAAAAVIGDTDALRDPRSAALDAFWGNAEIAIDGDPAACQALRFNMFQVFQSAPRDGQVGLAAKGLTGEGYEGHTFWDGEIFVLPMLSVTAPHLARAMLDYRYATLEAARANARALDHDRGALFAWRTIAGREASAHYPSGSAQYHINADIAFAIGLYDMATGDTEFLIDKGAEILAETARIWLQIGHFAPTNGGKGPAEFRILGVTGPDEYTALIDDNWYTNRMAQRHLRLAADTADRMAIEASEAWAATRRRIALDDAEIAEWRRAADTMRLPFDAARNLDAQDDSFLDKPEWDIVGTPKDGFPLLLHHHPMTLYRHQVAKQADLVLALVLAGDDISLERKRRAFDHYSRVTVHDSTLSDCSFAILASEVGRGEAAMRHFRAAAFVDLHDLHNNSHHGAHMAAMGGSWQALVWGFGGFRPRDGVPGFAPTVPSEWTSYSFTMLWRGTRLRIDVDRDGTAYRHLDGPPLTAEHRGQRFTLDGGERCFPPGE
jgi:alpha,alpha-trehalose phosphorylase